MSGELPATDIADIAKSFIQPFELDQAPLFRVELAVVSGKQYLMIDMHHIISDGVSMSLLLKEFTKLYKGESLEPLRIQYKDFAQWQNGYLRSGGQDQQAAYWKNNSKETFRFFVYLMTMNDRLSKVLKETVFISLWMKRWLKD